jgi:hypothetical protein
LAAELDITPGCTFTLNTGVMWRFTTSAQASAFSNTELAISQCPAPRVVSAAARSLTEVVLTFDRSIASASITDVATQFTFTEGLTASAAQVSGRQVILTTSGQTAGTSYTVTVASSVTDRAGTPVSGTANTGTFTGYRPLAVLRITEVNPNMGSNADLVELQVITAGTTLGLVLQQDVTSSRTLATLPDVGVAAGDIIVVHINGTDQNDERTAKNQFPASSTPTNYDNAWDFRGASGGANGDIQFSSRILLVRDGAGNLQDAASFVRPSVTAPGAFPTNLQSIQTAGQWLPADCGGQPCSGMSTPTAQAVSVDWSALSTSTTNTGNTVRRISATDTNTRDDWAVGAQSWGVANP